MAGESLFVVGRRRLLGVLYLVIVVSLVGLSIAIYNKDFEHVVLVTLKTDHTGNELVKESDVKVRGIIVGYVKNVSVASGSGACVKQTLTCVDVTLAIDPSRTNIIPTNVSAQILPKTLFGEEYVSLIRPTNPGPDIRSGDIIGQDRSRGALEAQRVLGDLMPLLTAVQPAQLNATLTALATALSGRGKQLGHLLVESDTFLKSFNPHTKAMVSDLVKLGQVAQEYHNVAPDVLSTLRNLETSARTVLQKKEQLNNLLTSATSTSTIVTSFLSDNGRNMIHLVGTTAPIYRLLAQYSPEYTCLLGGLNDLAQSTTKGIGQNQIRLSTQLDQTSLGAYKQGEEPRLITGYGPACFGLPNPPVPFEIPGKYRCINDGAALTADPCAQRASSESDTRALGSPAEDALVSSVIAGSLGTTPKKVPAIATALAAPLLRGQVVHVK